MAEKKKYNSILVSGRKDETLTYSKYVKDEESGESVKESLDKKVNVTDELTTQQIKDGAITNEKMAADSVTTAKIADGNVTTEKIKDKNVTNEKLADNSVSNEKIKDKSVTNSKLGDNSVDGRNLISSSVENRHIGNNAVSTSKIASRSVTNEKIAYDSVSREELTPDVRSSIDKKADAEQVNNSLYDLEKKIGERVVVEGDVINLPDEEDLTSVKESERNVLKLADKSYAPENFSGKGYKRLRKNIQKINLAVTKITVNSAPTKNGEILVTINNIDTHISLVKDTHNTPALVAQAISYTLVSAHTDYDIEVAENIITLTRKHSGEVASSAFDAANTGVTLAIEDSTKSVKRNILTKDMINKSNTIYEIKYDFDLDGATINLQEHCVLNFKGGRIFNGELKGTVENSYLYPDYFYNNSGDYSYAVQQCFNICSTLRLNKLYPIKRKITTKVYTRIISDCIKLYGFESYIDNDYMLYINSKENGESITTPWSNCEIIGVKFIFHNNGGGYNPNPYFNGGKAILKSTYLVLDQCSFYYFDTSLECKQYSDNTTIRSCDFFYGVNLKSDYNPLKHFDIIFANNGDNNLMENIQCANIKFNNVSNATIINCIQCGINMIYSSCHCIGYHNEEPSKYPIVINVSVLQLENGVIAKDNSIPIAITGYGVSRLSLNNFSYYNIVTTKDRYFSSAKFIKIDTPDTTLLTLCAKNLRNNMSSSYETYNIYIKRENINIVTPNVVKYIYDSSSNKSTIYDKQYKSNTYLYDSFHSIKDKYNLSTLSNGKYIYKVYEILDNKRKLLKYMGEETINTEEGNINTITIFGNKSRKEVLICREFNNIIKCAFFKVYAVQGTLEDYGNVYTNNNLQWEDNIINDYSIIDSVDYKGDNVVINSKVKVKANNNFLNNDKLIVGNITYIYNGTDFITNIGTTNDRPISPQIGFIYKDTTLNKLILWEGSKWVNLDGSELS